jgi:hypothetical protein
MTKDLFSRRSLTLSGAIAIAALSSGLMAVPASAAITQNALTQSGVVDCSLPQLSQPYLSAADANWYTLLAGQTPDDFNGAGWTLSGGAKLVTTRLADGQTGRVLDLPSGATAVSPTMCVNNGYQTARTNVRDVVGTAGANVSVSYVGTGSNAVQSEQVNGSGTSWSLSAPVGVLPSSRLGWQHVTFTLSAAAKTGDYQISNFWVDPRSM